MSYMNRDSRLSVALHVLLHMREMGEAATSEALGAAMDMSPVVLRRTLGGLRDAGIVSAEKGHGGGWSLARDLGDVSLGEVYEALGPSTLFGIGVRDPHPTCPVEKAVNVAVGGALDRAEAVFHASLAGVRVAELLERARRAMKKRS